MARNSRQVDAKNVNDKPEKAEEWRGKLPETEVKR